MINKNNIKTWLFYILIIIIPLAIIFSGYLVYTAFRTATAYNAIKTNQHGWTRKVHRADKELGFAPIANSSGFESMPIGQAIPMRYDGNGFRVKIDNESDRESRHPVILTLGDSFTYGSATYAKDTFPYLLGLHLNSTTKNAGVGSYGLSQMVLLAEKLIPNHKLDYVVVQYSPWLVDRAINPFTVSRFWKIPVPYYSDDEGQLVIKPPIFDTKITSLPLEGYRTSRASVRDYLSFLWNVGIPQYFYDDFHMSAYAISRVIGMEHKPTSDRSAVIKHAYGSIQSLAKKNGVKLIIVVLGRSINPVQVINNNFPRDAILVDAHSALLDRLPVKDQKNYNEHYKHWRGEPPVIVDNHPNEKAHRVIAEEIAFRIANMLNKK